MLDELLDALAELSDYSAEELAEEIPDIIDEVCQYVWIMELIIALCKKRRG